MEAFASEKHFKGKLSVDWSAVHSPSADLLQSQSISLAWSWVDCLHFLKLIYYLFI